MTTLAAIREFNQILDEQDEDKIIMLINRNLPLLHLPLDDITLGADMICAAAEYGYIDVMEYLVQNGVSINSTKSTAVPHRPIYSAIVAEQTEAVRWLIDHGAEVNYSWNSPHPFCSIIASTIRDGQHDYTRMLVEAGAILNAKDRNDMTPLDWAIGTRNQELIDYLRAKGALTAGELDRQNSLG